MSIGSNIRKIRIAKGLTQKELGDRCGMADSAIRRYESNRGNPTDKTLRRIATALEVSPAYLQGWDAAVEGLEAAGMSLEDVASEMNIPVEVILDIVNSQEPSSTEATEKIIRVASMIAKEATKNAKTQDVVYYHTEQEEDENDRQEALCWFFSMLNEEGQQEAIKRVMELTEIPRYRQDAVATEGIQPSKNAAFKLVGDSTMHLVKENREVIRSFTPANKKPSDGV